MIWQISIYRVNKFSKSVCYEILLEKAHCEPLCAVYRKAVIEIPCFSELRKNCFCSRDRSGRQLRKKSNICRVRNKVLFCFFMAAVNIDQVPGDLKCVKGYPKRKDDLESIEMMI